MFQCNPLISGAWPFGIVPEHRHKKYYYHCHQRYGKLIITVSKFFESIRTQISFQNHQVENELLKRNRDKFHLITGDVALNLLAILIGIIPFASNFSRQADVSARACHEPLVPVSVILDLVRKLKDSLVTRNDHLFCWPVNSKAADYYIVANDIRDVSRVVSAIESNKSPIRFAFFEWFTLIRARSATVGNWNLQFANWPPHINLTPSSAQPRVRNGFKWRFWCVSNDHHAISANWVRDKPVKAKVPDMWWLPERIYNDVK